MAYKHLTQEERYQIYAFRKAGFSQQDIAISINRSPSTVSREIKRNCGQRGYRPKQAQRLYEERHQTNARTVSEDAWRFAVEKLNEDWSPDQISHHARISHETIYQRVYADKRAGGSCGRICAARRSCANVMDRLINGASFPNENPSMNVLNPLKTGGLSAISNVTSSSARIISRRSSPLLTANPVSCS